MKTNKKLISRNDNARKWKHAQGGTLVSRRCLNKIKKKSKNKNKISFIFNIPDECFKSIIDPNEVYLRIITPLSNNYVWLTPSNNYEDDAHVLSNTLWIIT